MSGMAGRELAHVVDFDGNAEGNPQSAPGDAIRPSIDIADWVDTVDSHSALQTVPRGAMAVCGIAVGLLVLAWLYVYFGIFLPRGTIG